ncbi:MAG: hypothetical protein K0R17_3161 [Rariglobus sp.]|jgi:hypothetical protein|nr:hypothetical protein [Rariglobus sp.]
MATGLSCVATPVPGVFRDSFPVSNHAAGTAAATTL